MKALPVELTDVVSLGEETVSRGLAKIGMMTDAETLLVTARRRRRADEAMMAILERTLSDVLESVGKEAQVY